MKKIPSIFVRDWDGNPRLVTRVENLEADWVFRKEGVAHQKLDGTSCAVINGVLYKRREVRAGKTTPDGFIKCEHDTKTDKVTGWIPVTDIPDDAHHLSAWSGGGYPDGTYELVGPKVAGNPEGAEAHVLIPHGATKTYPDVPLDFDGMKAYLEPLDIEGFVFHHPDGRMAKIKKSDFGLSRQ